MNFESSKNIATEISIEIPSETDIAAYAADMLGELRDMLGNRAKFRMLVYLIDMARVEANNHHSAKSRITR